MANPNVLAQAAPIGGVTTLTINGAVSGVFTLERAASGMAFSTIASGTGICPTFFVDLGEGLPAPLDPTQLYQYRYTDPSGQTITPFISPSAILDVEADPFTQIMIRLIQAGLNSLTIPNGFTKPQVTHAMPLGGQIPLPLIVVNQDLMQQAEPPIGQSQPLQILQNQPNYIIEGMAKRIYRISVLSDNAVERSFFRDQVVGIFVAAYQPIFSQLGLDIEHRWQVSTGQVASDVTGKMPGFYFSEILLEFTGIFNVSISSSYGFIAQIDFKAMDQNNALTEVLIPP